MLKLVIFITCLLGIQGSVYSLSENSQAASIFRSGGKIIGGNAIDISEAPWSASIIYLDIFHFCTGVIITPTAILTVAYCFGYPIIDLTVRVGSADYSEGGEWFNVTDFIKHENYSYLSFVNDVGIVFIDGAITITSASPITLPTQGETVTEGALAISSGWGLLIESDIEYPEELRSAELLIVNQEECARNNSIVTPVTEGMICAAVSAGDMGPCVGDFGGSLTVDGVLVGIFSWTYQVGCVRPNYPSVYTRASSYVDWINDQLNNSTALL